MFKKIPVANRGEIACRLCRIAKRMALATATLIASLSISLAFCDVGSARASDDGRPRKGYQDELPSKPNGTCFLSVNHRTRINGPCLINRDKDGSFEFDDNRMVLRCAFKGRSCGGAALGVTRNGVFGYLSLNKNALADLSWNEGNQSHAQALLGPVARRGACWIGHSPGWPPVKLCVSKAKKLGMTAPRILIG